MVGVLEPSTLGHDREVAAELARHGSEPGAQVVHREGRPTGIDLGVHDLAAAGVPVRVGALLARARLVDRQLRRDGESDLLSGQQVSHELPAGPAVCAGDRDSELLVGQIGERLERPERVVLLIEEFQSVDVHPAIVAAPARRTDGNGRVRQVNDDGAPAVPPVDPAAAAAGLAATYSPELLASLLVDGDDDLAAWTIRQALDDAPRVQVYDELVADAMRLVGQRWESGQWSVADEHLASQTLQRALEAVRPDPSTDARIGPLAVLAGAAGEHHAIGLILLDHVLAERGWTVANLGADVPAADLGRFVAGNEAAIVALTASDPARLAAVAGSISAVRVATSRHVARLPVMLGGRLGSRPEIATSLDLDWAGATLAGAVGFADRIMAERTTAEG
jgi:methanogenic corrinoid protein MtbC1